MTRLIFILFLIIHVMILLATTFVENQCMVNKLSFKNCRIVPISIYHKQTIQELLDASSKLPWFEFFIDNKLLTSKDSVWKYVSLKIRNLNI